VGEGGDEVSVARFIADQRTLYRVPLTVCCAILGVSLSWFYKWRDRVPTPRQERRQHLDALVAQVFGDSGRTYGSPRIHAELVADGEAVSVNTVADSMARQGLVARAKRRPHNTTKQDRKAKGFPDLLRRDFTAAAQNQRWCGDITELPTDEGKLYLASVLDLYSRRLLAAPTSIHPDAELVSAAVKIAATVRGGRGQVEGVVFHSDRGSTYTAAEFGKTCKRLGIRQSMGRVGSCFDNAAAESFFSTLEHEVLSRHHFKTRAEAKAVVTAWCYDFYNHRRRHSSAAMMAPIDFENTAVVTPDAA
jgi:transposase InsO family protein